MASASTDSPLTSTPTSNSSILAQLFREQQEQNMKQSQLLANKIATSKRPCEWSLKRTEKTRIGDWHRVFNSRCVKTLDQLLEAESAEEVCDGLEELQQ
uniref:Uncharacterized protein n=1 Tax=Plectus sambesii TaxID=2011161 RepID=A0A914UP79_9BILA